MTTEIRTIHLGFVNCYLIDESGEGFILVDTGLPSQRDALEKALSAAGCEPGNLKLIVLTHGDIDHTGNAAWLREKYSTRIGMNRDDVRLVKENGGTRPKRIVKSLPFKIMFGVMGLFGGMEKMAAGFEHFQPDVYLEEGQSLYEYGFDATVLHIPGHTPGSISLLAANGALIAGDTLENRGHPRDAMIVADETQLAASITKLLQLNITNVYPGHGKPFLWEQFATNYRKNNEGSM